MLRSARAWRSSSVAAGASGPASSARSVPTSRRIEPRASAPAASIRARASGATSGCSRPHRLRGLGLHDDAGDVVGDDVVELPGDGEPLVLAHVVEVAAALVVDPSQVQPGPRGQGEAEGVGDDEQAVVADVVAGPDHGDEAGGRRRR